MSTSDLLSQIEKLLSPFSAQITDIFNDLVNNINKDTDELKGLLHEVNFLQAEVNSLCNHTDRLEYDDKRKLNEIKRLSDLWIDQRKESVRLSDLWVNKMFENRELKIENEKLKKLAVENRVLSNHVLELQIETVLLNTDKSVLTDKSEKLIKLNNLGIFQRIYQNIWIN